MQSAAAGGTWGRSRVVLPQGEGLRGSGIYIQNRGMGMSKGVSGEPQQIPPWFIYSVRSGERRFQDVSGNQRKNRWIASAHAPRDPLVIE